MLTFLVPSFLAAIAFTVVAICAIVWAVLFPIRLLFKLMFGLLGAIVSVLLVPILLLVVGVVAVAALAAAFIAALVPLLPLLAMALVAWAIYKGVSRRTSPAL